MNEYDNLIANQPVAGNEYDAILDDLSKQNRAAFVGAGLQARTATPDQHAEALTLGRETGVPPAVALTNRDDLMAQRETQRVDRIMQQSPILARWASVPENHGVAQDDFDALALLERTFTAMMYPAVGLAAQVGAVATGATDVVSKPLGGAARRIPGLAGSLVGGIHDIAEPAGDWLEITTGLSGIPEQELRDEDQLAALTRLSGWLRSFEGQGYDPMVKWDDVKSNPLLAPGFIAEQGVVSSPDMAAAMLALPAYITARTEEIATKRAENEGRPGEVTLGDMGKAAPAAIIESILERLTTKYLLAGSKAATPAGRVATQTATQTVTGGIEELTAYLGETVGTERGARGNEALDTFMAGALVEGGIGAGFEFAQVVAERAQTIERSVADQVRLQALTQAAAGLKTSERAPELVEQYVKQLREAGQNVPDSVYLSLDAARTFLQAQGMDANAELTNLAGSAEAMVEATATGDLKIPLERWLAYGAKRPDIAELQKHARLDPERLSPAELEALNLDDLIAEVMQDQERGNEAAARAEESAVGQDPVAQVRDDITGQLLAAGVDRSTAEAQAQVLAQRYATRAARRGKGETAAEVFALSGLEIVRETPALQKLRERVPEIDTVIDPLLDAVRTGRVPTQGEIYGPSLVSALIRAGGVQDSGGELRSRDARIARPGLVNRNGMTFDDALQFARENGYLPPAGDGVDALDVNAVIDLIDRELRGDPVYAVGNENARALGFSEAVDQIDADLRAKGIDTSTATNEEMKAALGITATEERGFDQPVFHGSPHRGIENSGFSLQKIGTGEGAQAYGWGLYFAGKREVAEHYRKTLSDGTGDTGSVFVRGEKIDPFSPEGHAARLLFYNDAREIKSSAKQWLKEAKAGELWAVDTAKKAGTTAVDYYTRLLDFVGSHSRRDIRVERGQLYTAEIPDDGDLVDYDAPIAKQSRAVQNVARDFLREAGYLRSGENGPRQLASSFREAAMALGGMARDGDGSTLYSMLAKKLGSEQAASLYFAERGIPGMRYKAGQIAGVKGGGHNYVIWDESAIRDVRTFYQSAPAADQAAQIDEATGLPLNSDGTVTVYHHTNAASAAAIQKTGRLKSAAEPAVYVTTRKETDTGYGGVAVEIRVNPDLLQADDEFPDGRKDYRIEVGRPGGSIAVKIGPAPRAFNQSQPVPDIDLSDSPRTRRVKIGDTSLSYAVQNGVAKVVLVSTPNAARGKGGARTAMTAFLQATDAAGLPVELTVAEQDSRTDPAKLEAFYGSLGFQRTGEEVEGSPRMRREAVSAQDVPVTETPEFKRWFGDSKVVDADGKPLVVYHGTGVNFGNRGEAVGGDFTEFDPSTAGKSSKTGAPDGSFFFTSDPEVASSYTVAWRGDFSEKLRDNANVMPVYLSIKKPLKVSAKGGNWRDIEHKGEFMDVNELAKLAMDDGRYDGLIVTRVIDHGVGKTSGNPSTTYVAFRPEQIKSVNNRGTFDPNDPRILYQRTRPLVTRGRIEFRPGGGARIVLTENANLSTFLHETGHLWLEELITDSQVNPELAADMDRVLAWMGLDVRSADGADAIRLAVQSDQHEQFARGFEAYLREGRAPSSALREIFARFRAWLVRLYRDVRSLNVELSDEVRGVFDRLIATDEEIARAQAANLQAALATSPEEAAALGMSPKEFADYAEARDRATQEAREEVEQELIAAWERQSREEYQRERERMRIEVEAEVNRQLVFRAILALQADRESGGIRLDRRELVDRYGEAYLKRLPGPGRDRNRGRYVYAVEGGMSLDEAGLLLGYDSGDALVQALVNAQDRQAVIEGETDARMLEFYPDPMTDGSIAERARKAVHSGARAEVLDRELRVLAKAAGAKPYQARVIASIAERMIGRKAIRALRPNEYLVAERKAGREAMQALAAKQFDIAYRARFRQALNARLFRLATDAQDRVEADRKYLRRFDKRGLREKIGKAGNGWLEAIDSLLADYNLQTLSGAEIDRRAASRQILEAAEQGLIDLPDAVRQNLESARQTNWRELTVDDMRGLVDAVRQLETVAIREWRMIVDGEVRMIDDDAAAIADSVRSGGRYVEPNLGSKSKAELMAKWGREALAIWLRPAAIARQADGGEERGALTRLIIEPMRRAVSEKLEPMKAKARDDLAALYGKFYSRSELIAMSTRRQRIAEIGQDWTKFDLLALALNWGNEQNRQAVLEGRANGRQVFTETGVKNALRRLDARDWQFVQAVWDYVNTYWPEIEAAQKRRTGLAPAKVEAKPFEFVMAGGEVVSLRGGYYPLKYDSDTDANTRADDLEDAFQRIRAGRYGKAATSRGHTVERVGSGRRPVRMDINVLHQHVSSVIHDLALGDVVDYTYKVLNNGATKAAFSETAKLEDWKALNIWLKDAAAGEMAARTFADKAFRWIRIGFTKSKLGFNIVTALLQPTGFAQTAVVTGKRAFLRGALSFASSPVAAWKQVQDASAFMRARYSLNAWNKDVQDTLDALRGKHGLIPSWVGPAMFVAIGKTQQVVDTVTWLAAYNKAHDGGETHAEAVKFADGIVENAQTSGFFSDRSALERGTLSDTTRQSEFVRAWTALASYMIAKGNIAYERARTTNYRSPAQVANLIGDMMLLFTVEAVLAAAIRGTLPEEDDDWWWWLAGSSAESVAATVPFIREVPSAVKGFAVGGGPVGTLLNDIGKAWTQAQQGELDASLIKSANNVGGTLFHYPSAQMNRAIDAYWRENVEGEDVAPIEYLTGRRDPR